MLKPYEITGLLRAAKVCESEALTWCEGFAVKRNGRWEWNDKEYDWAHLRAIHLENSAALLRKIAARHRD